MSINYDLENNCVLLIKESTHLKDEFLIEFLRYFLNQAKLQKSINLYNCRKKTMRDYFE